MWGLVVLYSCVSAVAYDTELSAEDALKALDKAPMVKTEDKEEASRESPLDKAMRGTKQPNIENESADDTSEELSGFDQMLADFELIHGKEK